MSLRSTMVSGVFWSFIEKLGFHIVSFVVFIVIARIIGPKEYGIVAICYIFSGLISTIYLVLADGVVSLKVSDISELSTLFWGVVLIGIVLSLFGMISSVFITAFIKEPRLSYLMAMISPVAVIQSVGVVPGAILMSQMKFKVMAIRTILATILGGTVGIILAIMGLGAISLIIYQLVYVAASSFVLWLSVSWRPLKIFKYSKFCDLISPGIKTVNSNLGSFLQDQLPRIFIGIYLSPVEIGYYSFSNRISSSIREIVVSPLTSVMFPALSMVNADPEKQNDVVLKIFNVISILLMPIIFIAIVFSQYFIPFVFGLKWASAVVVVQLFLLSVVVHPFITIIQSVFRANNCMSYYLRINNAIILISLMSSYISSRHSIYWVVTCMAVINITSLPLYVFMVASVFKINYGRLFAALVIPTFSILMPVVAIWAIMSLIGNYHNNFWICLACVIVVVALYITSIKLFMLDYYAIVIKEVVAGCLNLNYKIMGMCRGLCG